MKQKTKKEEAKIEPAKEANIKREVGRIVSNSYYDMQGIRISTTSRIRDVVRKKIEGIAPDAVEEKKEEEDREEKYDDKKLHLYLNNALDEGKITPREHEYIEKCLKISEESQKIEKQYQAAMRDFIKDEPIYTEFLEKIKGIGDVLSANLIKNFAYCEKFDKETQLWSITGNAVTPQGKAPKRTAGEELHFNPKLRTLTWKISDCLMKSNKGLYRRVYETSKAEQLARTYEAGELYEKYGKPYKKEDLHLSKLHAHNRALRKIRKLFLSHYFEATKELTKQPVRPHFVEKLGHTGIIGWRKAVSMESEGKPRKVVKDKITSQ